MRRELILRFHMGARGRKVSAFARQPPDHSLTILPRQENGKIDFVPFGPGFPHRKYPAMARSRSGRVTAGFLPSYIAIARMALQISRG